MLEWLWTFWLIPAPYISYFFFRFLQNRKDFIYSDGEAACSSPFIIFQITSKSGPESVKNVIKRLREVVKRLNYNSYRIDTVIDVPKKFDANNITVPADYTPSKGGKFKARALQYAVEYRRRLGENRSDLWIFHLDEESLVTEQTLRAVFNYLHDPDAAPIAEGPITYPDKLFEVGLILRYCETMRIYICYDCVSQMKGSLPTHMHGSNLLVRADVEDKVGWDFRGVVASEDQRFGHEAWRQSYRFGWHGGLLEEQPAANIGNLLRQRRRWFIGNMHNLYYGSLPLRKKLDIFLRWLSWGLGFIAGLVSVIALFIGQNIPMLLRVWLTFVSLAWLWAYQEGLRLNLRNLGFSRWKRLRMHLVCLAITPILGLVETFAAFTAPLYLRGWEWVPTLKL